jgi:hypothetical protein
MAWVAPAFSQFDLGEQYTAWLYSDPQSNPDSYNDPSRWPGAGVVMVQSRSVITDVPAATGAPFTTANTATINLDLAGGKNAVVFARYCSVVPGLRLGGGIGQQLPTQTWGYVWVRQTRQDGYLEIQDTVLPTVFGVGWSPQDFPAPIMWNDKLKRTLTLSNVGLLDVTVSLTWDVAYLNTGA